MNWWWQGMRFDFGAAKNGGRGDLEDGGKVVSVEVFGWRQVHDLYSNLFSEASREFRREPSC